MRKIAALLLLLLPFFQGCEDVIDAETTTQPPKLNVEALMRVDLGEDYVPVVVKVAETSNFFGEIPVTELENIVIFTNLYDSQGDFVRTEFSYLYEEVPGSGIYVPDPNFTSDQRIPTFWLRDFRAEFELYITHKGRNYFAATSFAPSVPIANLRQGTRTLNDPDDTEVAVRFTDDPARQNYYIFDFGFGNYLASSDSFYQGRTFEFSYFYDQSFESGTELEIGLLGADEQFYNYMALLIEQSESSLDPFQTPVATVRGNIFDVTGIDNVEITDNVGRPDSFPLGYFAVVEEFRQTLTIR